MAAIYTRLAQMSDLPAIMKIIADAKEFLKAAGSTQWQSGYPNEATIQHDILAQVGYCLLCGEEVVGYAAVIVGPDPNYHKIAGAWNNDQDPYATIHRIAMSNKYQGQHLAGKFVSNLISLYYARNLRNFRVDTGLKNQPMQALAKSQGFVKCGIVRVDNPLDPDRVGLELNL